MKLFQKITALLLSIIVVLSTLSFSAITHYCGGEAVAISYFGDSESCGNDEGSCCNADDVLKKSKANFKKTPCCKDIKSQISSSNFLKSNSAISNVISFNAIFTSQYFNFEQKTIAHFFTNNFYYKIIYEKQNLQILFQSFLI
ncbi:MAG: hypothetical protein V3U80_07425 [Flavobacteriaceae bacterium]